MVAEEIRKMAVHSSEAVYKIRNLLESTKSETHQYSERDFQLGGAAGGGYPTDI